MNLDKIVSIIKEPVHGERFYTKETMKKLIEKVQEICTELEIYPDTPQYRIIEIINNYIKCNVGLRKEYFDTFCERTDKFNQSELPYRTAYGALVKGEAMCAGYAEAERILLSQYGIDTHTLLSKLPGKNKRLLHYVVLARYKKGLNDEYAVLDPERQMNCERKGMDYELYKSKMIYMLPTAIFTNNVIGTTGVGMEAEEYMSHIEVPRIQGTDGIEKIIGVRGDDSSGRENYN